MSSKEDTKSDFKRGAFLTGCSKNRERVRNFFIPITVVLALNTPMTYSNAGIMRV